MNRIDNKKNGKISGSGTISGSTCSQYGHDDAKCSACDSMTAPGQPIKLAGTVKAAFQPH